MHQNYPITVVEVEVLEDSRVTGDQFRTTVKLKQVSSYFVTTEATGRITILMRLNEGLYQGEKVKVYGTLHLLEDTLVAYFYGTSLELQGFNNPLFKIRKNFKQLLTTHSKVRLGKAFGLWTALMTGDYTFLDPITNQVFLETGLNHQLVLSGWHIGLVLALVYWLFKNQGKRQAGLWAIPLLLLYWVLSGFQYSLGRAVIMALVAIFCTLYYTRVRPIDLLSFSLVFILLTDPLSLDSLSLQFSYLAMAGIIFFMQPMNKLSQKLLHGFKSDEFSMALSAQLLLSPLLLYYFGRLYPVSLFLGFISTFLISSYMVVGLVVVLWPVG